MTIESMDKDENWMANLPAPTEFIEEHKDQFELLASIDKEIKELLDSSKLKGTDRMIKLKCLVYYKSTGELSSEEFGLLKGGRRGGFEPEPELDFVPEIPVDSFKFELQILEQVAVLEQKKERIKEDLFNLVHDFAKKTGDSLVGLKLNRYLDGMR